VEKARISGKGAGGNEQQKMVTGALVGGKTGEEEKPKMKPIVPNHQ